MQQALQGLTGPALKRLAFLLGASGGANKAAKVGAIAQQAALFDRISGSDTATFTSIDTGVINLAVASVVCSANNSIPTLSYWNKTNLEQRFRKGETLALAPEQTALLATQVASDLTTTPELRNTSLFTIEKQRTRTVGSSAVSDPILKLNIMEHLLYAGLTQNLHRTVVSSDPGRMTRYWVPKERETATGLKSKRLRVDLVRQIVLGDESKLLQLDPALKHAIHTYKNTPRRGRIPSLFDALQLHEPLNGVRKDDDLTDALLHALAWAHWYNTYMDMRQCLKGTNNELTHFIDERYHHWQTDVALAI